MAEVLETMPEQQRRSKYPLDEWLDGRIHALVVGEDFTQKSTSMRSVLYTAAKAQGKRVETRGYTDEKGRKCIAVRAVAETNGKPKPAAKKRSGK